MFQKEGSDNEVPPILQPVATRKLRRLFTVGSSYPYPETWHSLVGTPAIIFESKTGAS